MENDYIIEEITERLINRRHELKLSYQNLSDRTGYSKSTLQRYETGGIKGMPLERLYVLANALEIEPYYLLGWDIKENPTPYNAILISHEEMELHNNYTKVNTLGKKKIVDYSSDLVSTGKYKKINDKSLKTITQNENKITCLEDSFTTIAAHDDNLTNDEKTEMDKRIIEALNKMSK